MPGSGESSPRTAAPLSLHAARLADAAARAPPSPPRMFVHRAGETLDGRSHEFETLMETSARRMRARQASADGRAPSPSPTPSRSSKARAGDALTPFSVAIALPASPSAPSPSLFPPTPNGIWPAVKPNTNGTTAAAAAALAQRSPSSARTSVQFEVRAGGGSGEIGKWGAPSDARFDTGSPRMPPSPALQAINAAAAHTYSPYLLFFDSYALECEYRYLRLSEVDGPAASGGARARRDSRQMLWGLVALGLLFFATLAPNLWHLNTSTGVHQIAIACVGAALYVAIFACNRLKHVYREWVAPATRGMSHIQESLTTSSAVGAERASFAMIAATRTVTGRQRLRRFLAIQPALGVLFCCAGCCWTIGSVLLGHLAGRPQLSAPTFTFLIIGFLMLDVFLFAHLFVSSWIITCVYTGVSLGYGPEQDPWIYTVARIIFVAVATAVLCYNAYYTELSSRLSFLKQRQLQTTKHALQRETAELRSEVFSLVLEKFDIADVSGDARDANVDLSSPLERSMQLLQELERDRSLSKAHFDKIRRIIEQLGSSNDDIFRPQMAQIVGSAARVGYFKQARTASAHRRNATMGSPSNGGGFFAAAERSRTRNNAGGGNSDLGDAPRSVNSSSGGTSARQQLDDDTVKWLSGLVDDFPENQTSAPGDDIAFAKQASLTSYPTNLISSDEEQTIHLLTGQLTDWNFDVFDVCKLTRNRPLFFLGLVLFRKHDLIRKFRIDKEVLCNFLNAIEDGYFNDKPYHNSTHGADVTRSMHYFISVRLKQDLTDLEILACLIASLTHDFQHPGVSNNYLVRTRHELSLKYNDKSCLENMHLSATFQVLSKPDNNILASLTATQHDSLRKMVIDMVLATDLGQHFEIVGHFKNALPRLRTGTDRATDASKTMVLKFALKCSDIAHSAKMLDLHLKWSSRVVEEFYQQGDQEREAGIPISPFMDRHTPNLSRAQLGFLDFLAMPMFTLWTEYLDVPECQIILHLLRTNRAYWLAMDSPTPERPAPDPTHTPPPINSTPTTNTDPTSTPTDTKSTAEIEPGLTPEAPSSDRDVTVAATSKPDHAQALVAPTAQSDA